MNPSREEALFALALEKSGAERTAFLERECAGDAALRQRVEALLAARDQTVGSPSQADRANKNNPVDEIRTVISERPLTEEPGTLIGRYKLLEKIGEGGFGVVYVAEQREPVKRRIALKIIKLGMDTKQVVARFEAERQALAMMDHPNIAKVLDAGATDTGRPYFVMELVRGIPITKYCDENHLPTDERLSLFTQVCHAIQHAHQKGIIHRDIKPSNILVTLHDGAPVPKVIDFGIAKATQGDLTDKTVYTQLNQFIGTPAYMSPEQAEMSGLDIDTRSDIYSLGVLLYELLVGKTPFDAKQLLESGLDAMRKTIREQEPVRPSTRLTSMMGEEKTTTAKRRGADIPKLITLLRGDLDWIVMKCLEKDRTRRYETANGLAADIKRHLSSEPVAARPPSRIYKLQKFARRNKAAALAAAVVVFALILGLGSSTLALLRERQAHRIANAARAMAENERQSTEAARVRAEENALTARRNAYAADMFAAQQAFENSNLGRARDLLKAHWPMRGEPDLRGFEWRYLWNLCRGDNFHTFGYSNGVRCVAFSPDGRTLAAGCGKSVELSDVTSRRLVATLPASTNGVAWLAFSNEGETLATTGEEGLIKLWNVKTHQLISTLSEDQTARIAFSPVGTLLAISYGHSLYGDAIGGPIKLLNYVTRQVVRIFPDSGSRMAFSPDGKILAARSGYDAVKLWNVATGQELRKLDNAGNVLCLSFSPDGQTVATGNWDGEVNLWNVATGKKRLPLQGHTTQVWGLAFSPDGRRLATGSSDQTVRFWNLATGKEEWKLIGHGSEVRTLAFAPNGTTLATGGKDAMVMLWNTAPKPAETVITNVDLPPSFSPDNKLLATSKFGGPATVWDVATRQPFWVLDSERFALFPDDGGTLATISTNRILRFWDLATKSFRRAVPLPGITDSPRRFYFALRGARLAAADEEGVISLHDTQTGGMSWKFQAHAGFIQAMTFSQDGQLLATTGAGQPLKLWNVATQKELPAESSHQGQAEGLAFSPDGLLVATASYDDTVGFSRVATGKAEAPITGIKEGCSGVTFSLDGKSLAVACEDGTVRIWNLATRREVAVLKHGKLPLRFVVFSSDGQTLVSVCEDGTMRFWNAPNPDAPHLKKDE